MKKDTLLMALMLLFFVLGFTIAIISSDMHWRGKSGYETYKIISEILIICFFILAHRNALVTVIRKKYSLVGRGWLVMPLGLLGPFLIAALVLKWLNLATTFLLVLIVTILSYAIITGSIYLLEGKELGFRK